MKKKTVIACWVLFASIVSGRSFAQANECASWFTVHNLAFVFVGLLLFTGVYYKQFFMRRKNRQKGRVHHDASDD